MLEVEPGVFAMYQGDLASDDLVDLTDYSVWEAKYSDFAFGVEPTDLNGDGVASVNQMNETNCFNGSFITLNSDNTFVADSKGLDINIDGTTSTIECFDDGNFTGTWVLVGNQLYITYTEDGDEYTDVATLSGNTIVSTVENGEVVGTTSTGEPVYLTSNLQIVFTK